MKIRKITNLKLATGSDCGEKRAGGNNLEH
jgi:hypothetical protein